MQSSIGTEESQMIWKFLQMANQWLDDPLCTEITGPDQHYSQGLGWLGAVISSLALLTQLRTYLLLI